MKKYKNKSLFIATVTYILSSLLMTSPSQAKEQDCAQYSNGEWVDRVQARTYSSLCRTVRWVDGLFGRDEKFDASNFRGRVLLGVIGEEGESLDPKLRIRLKSKLPNMSKRFNAFIGRVDEDDFIREANRDNSGSIINRNTISRNSSDDTSWLIGLGYKRFPDRGFSFSAGAKFSSGLEPYGKVKHRYLSPLKSPHYLSFNQLAFIEKDDGYGFSSSYDYSYELNNNDILRWGSGLKYTEELRKWETSTSLTWFHRLEDNRGFSFRGFAKDIEGSQVSIPEYGLAMTYRQPLHRDWLNLEFGIEKKWIRENLSEERDSIIQVGVQVEMLFGKKRKKKPNKPLSVFKNNDKSRYAAHANKYLVRHQKQ